MTPVPLTRPTWRSITDFAKRKQWPLRVADRLGRGRGHFRVIDRLHAVPPAPLKPGLAGWADYPLAAAWIGHATVLLRVGGLTLLTDPVFSRRVGLGLGLATAGPLRLQRPALELSELPPVDVLLLSHAHFDHLDRPTLARLPRHSRVVTFAGVGDLVRDLGFAEVVELDWGRSFALGRLTITGLPAQHWGARTFYDTHRRYGAFLLDAGDRRVLYGADTAYHEQWRGLGPVDLAVLGIGAYDPYVASHATPEQAMRMADHVEARHVLPVHHSTFVLSHEPVAEPMQRLRAVAAPGRVVIDRVGGFWADPAVR
jgi:L-ascorbate metabolism protein UlaG (beta-lactamase superfamily)